MSTTFESESSSPEAIARDIDATRAELHRILDALEAKLSVRRRVDGVVSSARENGAVAASLAMEAARTYRKPLLVAGATVLGLIVARSISRRR